MDKADPVDEVDPVDEKGRGASWHSSEVCVGSPAFRRPGHFSFLVLCVLYLTSVCDERAQRIRKKK
jgi:hypothetical protein